MTALNRTVLAEIAGKVDSAKSAFAQVDAMLHEIVSNPFYTSACEEIKNAAIATAGVLNAADAVAINLKALADRVDRNSDGSERAVIPAAALGEAA